MRLVNQFLSRSEYNNFFFHKNVKKNKIDSNDEDNGNIRITEFNEKETSNQKV